MTVNNHKITDHDDFWFALWGLVPEDTDMSKILAQEMAHPLVDSIETFGKREVLIIAHVAHGEIDHRFHELFDLQKRQQIEPVSLDNHDFVEFAMPLLFTFNGHLSNYRLRDYNLNHQDVNGIHSLQFECYDDKNTYINLSKVGVLTMGNLNDTTRQEVLADLRQIIDHNNLLMGE